MRFVNESGLIDYLISLETKISVNANRIEVVVNRSFEIFFIEAFVAERLYELRNGKLYCRTLANGVLDLVEVFLAVSDVIGLIRLPRVFQSGAFLSRVAWLSCRARSSGLFTNLKSHSPLRFEGL